MAMYVGGGKGTEGGEWEILLNRNSFLDKMTFGERVFHMETQRKYKGPEAGHTDLLQKP